VTCSFIHSCSTDAWPSLALLLVPHSDLESSPRLPLAINDPDPAKTLILFLKLSGAVMGWISPMAYLAHLLLVLSCFTFKTNETEESFVESKSTRFFILRKAIISLKMENREEKSDFKKAS
jgi:hypothetical protein